MNQSKVVILRKHSNKEKAVISGASGFIGQHLVSALHTRNIQTIAIPRSYLYEPYTKLQAFLHDVNPQYIYHFAGYGNHGQQQEEDKIIMANYFATWNLLQASKYLDYKAFINCATSSMYGHKDHAMYEKNGMNPDTFYAASKLGAMYLARAYAKQYQKPIVSVIPFSVFGEGEAPWRYIPALCHHLLTGEVMPISGNQEQTHDWIYQENFITGVLSVTDNIKKLQGEWINIGMGEKQTNKEIREMLEEISGRKLNVEIGGFTEQPHHSNVWYADNTKLRSLGWKPHVMLEEGLKRTWESYKDIFDRETENGLP